MSDHDYTPEKLDLVHHKLESQSLAKKPETLQRGQFLPVQSMFNICTTNSFSATARQAKQQHKQIKDANYTSHSDTSASHRLWFRTETKS